MNILRFLSLFCLALCSAGCQKYVNWTIDPDTKNVTGDTTNIAQSSLGKLVKMEAITAGETVVSTFNYSSNQRLSSELHTGTLNGLAVYQFKRYERDTADRIVRITEVLRKAGNAPDTVFTSIYYDHVFTANFTLSFSTTRLQGKTTYDSTLYTFDGNANPGLRVSYIYSSANSNRVIKKWTYTYANGNLTAVKLFADTTLGGALNLVETCKLSYDNKKNPQGLLREGLLTGRIVTTSKNNVTRLEMEYNDSAERHYSISTNYGYSLGGWPVNSNATIHPAGANTQYTFTYQ